MPEKARSPWLWRLAAVTGVLVFSLVWLLVGWLWLRAFPQFFGPLNPPGQVSYEMGTTYVKMGSGIVPCSTLPCPPPLEGAEKLLKQPLFSLLVLGLVLGATTGGAWQLWPNFSSRLLAFCGAMTALFWIATHLLSAFPLPPLHALSWEMGTPHFAWGWLHILPFVSPFLCAVGLLAFAAFSRSHRLAQHT